MAKRLDFKDDSENGTIDPLISQATFSKAGLPLQNE
jgi:hypothetical protein